MKFTTAKRMQYALFGLSFAMSRLDPPSFMAIKRVIIFGSVAAGTATDESDVDVFLDTDLPKKEHPRLRRTIQKGFDYFQNERFEKLLAKYAIQYTVREFSR